MRTLLPTLLVAFAAVSGAVAQLPDLGITRFDFVETAIEPNQQIVLVGEVTNISTTSAPASTAGFYLSRDAVLTTSDKLLISLATPALARVKTHRHTARVTIPATGLSGTCYLGFWVDRLERIRESRESNNKWAKPVTCKACDLVAVAPFDWEAPIGNRPSNYTARIRNAGTAMSPLTEAGLYASRDSLLTTNDVLLGRWAVPTLPPGRTHVHKSTYTPGSMFQGNCWFGFIADHSSRVTEIREDNNVLKLNTVCRRGSPQITKQPEDETLCVGYLAPSTVVMSVTATEVDSYQWRKNGVDLPGKNGPTLTLSTNIQLSDAGSYDCVLRNDDSITPITTTRKAQLTVGPCRVLRMPARVTEIVARVGDVDGDGYEDWAQGRPFFGSRSSGILITSGKTQATLADARFGGIYEAGTSIAAADIDGDGKSDVFFGAPAFLVGNVARGQILYRSSRQNRYFTFVTGTKTRLGELLATAQLDADGVPDIVAVDNSGQDLIAYSGKTRRVLWRHFIGDKIGALANLGDATGDGRDDLVIGLPFANQNGGGLEIRSGATGFRRHSRPGAQGSQLGFSVAAIGDCNGDGWPDFATGSPGAESNRGFVAVWSGATGLPFKVSRLAGAGRRFGYRVAAAGPVNSNGDMQILASEVPTTGTGAVVVLSGSGLRQKRRLSGTSRDFGYSIAGLDANGDCEPDIVVLDHKRDVWLYDAVPKANPPAFSIYGRTCPGTGGRLPRIGLAGFLPRVGGSATITLSTARDGSVALLKLARGRDHVALDAFGATGCSKHYATSLITLGIPTDTSGSARVSLPIPSDNRLTGVKIVWQWLPVDVGGNSLNLTFSNAAEMTIGAR